MKIVIIIVLIYLLSVWYNYRWVRKAYSKGGRFEYYRVGILEVIATLAPILNIIVTIYMVLETPHDKPRNFNKFFRVKDEEYKR